MMGASLDLAFRAVDIVHNWLLVSNHWRNGVRLPVFTCLITERNAGWVCNASILADLGGLQSGPIYIQNLLVCRNGRTSRFCMYVGADCGHAGQYNRTLVSKCVSHVGPLERRVTHAPR